MLQNIRIEIIYFIEDGLFGTSIVGILMDDVSVVKHNLRVTSCDLQVINCELKA